jgi:geranylgeranyl diphosphate synthase type I
VGPSSFADFLKQVQPRVEADLDVLLARETERVERDAPEVAPLVQQTRALTARGGKRLRAALVLLGYRVATRTADDARALPAASAMELLQTYFLIHDDWMDDDPVRRGGPSVHMALRETYGGKTLGDSGAILAGDYAVSLAQRTILACDVAPTRVLDAARSFASLQIDVVLGQGLDVLVDRPKALTQLMERTHLWKTAAYTTTGPLVVGACLGGASATLLDALRAYGDPLGVAFQLRDDWLGTFGDPVDTGKSNESDLRQGKKTAVLAALDGDSVHAEALAAFLDGGAGRERTPGEIAAMQERLRAAHVEERVTAAIAADSARARAAIPALEAGDLAVWLEQLIELVAERRA